MRSANHRSRARWFFLAGSLLGSLSGVARAQDAPTDAPQADSPPVATEPPGAVGSPPGVAPAPAPAPAPVPGDAPAPIAPPVTAPPAETSKAPEPMPLEPAASAPAASPDPGHAAFAPLPDAAQGAKPRRSAATTPAHEAAPAASREPTPAPAPAPAPAASEYSSKPSDAHDEEPWGGPFAPFRLGVLLGGGLPEVLSLGAQLKVTRYFGAGVNIGLIPTIHISYYGDAKIAYQEYDAYGHLYPFGGSFFIGAGVGYASIKGNLATRYNLPADLLNRAKLAGIDVSNPLTINSDASVRTLVLTPQIGFLHVFDVGFAIGLDVGAQIPIAPSEVHFSTVAPQIPEGPLRTELQRTYINPNDEKVRSTLDKIGRTPLPTFNLKIGWFL